MKMSESKSKKAEATIDTTMDQELCTFAIRLPKKDRDAIHKAAGPAGASRYARALLVAAANGDEATVWDVMKRGTVPVVSATVPEAASTVPSIVAMREAAPSSSKKAIGEQAREIRARRAAAKKAAKVVDEAGAPRTPAEAADRQEAIAEAQEAVATPA
jgi:hypothetical protein